MCSLVCVICVCVCCNIRCTRVSLKTRVLELYFPCVFLSVRVFILYNLFTIMCSVTSFEDCRARRLRRCREANTNTRGSSDTLVYGEDGKPRNRGSQLFTTALRVCTTRSRFFKFRNLRRVSTHRGSTPQQHILSIATLRELRLLTALVRSLVLSSSPRVL